MLAEGLQGIVSEAGGLLGPNGPELVRTAQKAGITVAAWGGVCNQAEAQHRLMAMGVDVIIADNVLGLARESGSTLAPAQVGERVGGI